VRDEQAQGHHSAEQPEGIDEREEIGPVKSSLPLIATPATIFAKATPHRSAGSAEPKKMAQSQVRRQVALSRLLPVLEGDRPRRIRATRNQE